LRNRGGIVSGRQQRCEAVRVTIFEAPDRSAAEVIRAADPVVAKGVVTGDLREMRVSLLRAG
jgi:uncharacterized protein YciI